MKITIKGNEVDIKGTVRAMMMYENIKGESFQPTSTENIITYMYCCVVSTTKDYSLSFDEFLDVIDEDMTIVNDFVAWLIAQAENQNKLKKE